MPDTSDERALATWLSRLDDAELAAVLTRRSVPPGAAWRDCFDAAEGLLDAASIDRALVRLSRAELVALARRWPSSSSLSGYALIREDGSPYAVVASRIQAAEAARPDAFRSPDATSTPQPADATATAAAAELVFTTIGALADVLISCVHTPLARTGAGSVSAADRRRLVDAGILRSADDLDDLVVAADAAALLLPRDREWSATPAGDAWLRQSTPSRWRIVAESLRSALPDVLRTPSHGYLPIADWPDTFPLDADWPERASRLARVAQQWGLTTASGEEPEWARRLREGDAPSADVLAEHLPAEIDRVYLQADLTAIAPGPLAPALDLRLRTIAHRESRAQASTYRFSAESLGAGMTEGETAESMRAFLTAISLTGIPQPLDYLIESTASRHGRVTVSTDAATGRTRIYSDSALRRTIAVDQVLRPLGLIDDGTTLLSRVARDAVYWALADARYPVVALDDTGTAVSLRRARTASETVQAPVDPYARLIGVLRAGSDDEDSDAAWLERELDQAVRARSVISVAVRLPDGSQRTFTLEASGLGGGRLRGRDRGSDVERTLPVSSIVEVRQVS